ncbi:MAG: sugar ABC transporter permease [Firmicutes bacterium]|nr:sugar ABC transporter permease [Bacillota bacterium]
MKKRNIKTNISGWLLLLLGIFLFYYLIWRPIFIGITYSFFDIKGFTPEKFVGLKNYKYVLSNTDFLRTLKNTVSYVFWSLIIGFPIPVLCAIMLNEMIGFKQYFKISFYLPHIMPAIAVSILWVNIYAADGTGLLNSVLQRFGVAPYKWIQDSKTVILLLIISSTWKGFGSTVLYYIAAIQSVNSELYEATRIDGCGFLNRARYVILPHLTPIMLLMLIMQIIGVFQILDAPMVMTDGGPNGASMTLALTAYKYAFEGHNKVGAALAVNVVTFVMLIGLTFVYYRSEKKMSA